MEESDESKWVWEDCPFDDAIFDDLWFAVRGGGGGTWGVVLSMYLQLHDYPGKHYLISRPELVKFCNEDLTDKQLGSLTQEYWKFNTQFLYDPKSLGINEHDSFSCGAPGGDMHCFGESSYRAFVDGWKDYLSSDDVAQRLRGIIGTTEIEAASKCYTVEESYDYPTSNLRPLDADRYAGLANDTPNPLVASGGMVANLQVPVKWLLDNYDSGGAPKMLLMNLNAYQVSVQCFLPVAALVNPLK